MHHENAVMGPLVLLMSLPVAFTIFYISFSSTAFDMEFYGKEFERYDVYGQLEGHDVDGINADVIGYISGKNNELDDMGFFSQRETLHLKDVRELIGKINRAAAISFAIFLISMILASSLLNFGRKKTAEKILLAIFVGSTIALIAALVLIISSTANFGSAFGAFHGIFFEAGTYSFDPQNEKIVVIYPEGLFFDALAAIMIKTIFSSAIFIIMSFWLLRRFFQPNFLKISAGKFRRRSH